MNNDALRVLISNGIVTINLLILIISMIVKNKNDVLHMRIVSMVLMILAYLTNRCFSSAIANIFTIGRDTYCAQAKKVRMSVVVVIIISGCILSGVISYRSSSGWEACLPIISFLIYSIGIFKAKSAFQVKLVVALDVALWIVYDLKCNMIICVLQDVFIILMTLATKYMDLEKKPVSDTTAVSVVTT